MPTLGFLQVMLLTHVFRVIKPTLACVHVMLLFHVDFFSHANTGFLEARLLFKIYCFNFPTCVDESAAYAPLPFALAQLGWPAGVTMLAAAGLVTWYTSLLLASLYRWDGKKHLRYCDLAESIYGVCLALLDDLLTRKISAGIHKVLAECVSLMIVGLLLII
jgi:Transmembrane amino acid transporter protein